MRTHFLKIRFETRSPDTFFHTFFHKIAFFIRKSQNTCFSEIKGVLPHLKAIFSYFQNINFIKVQAISNQNLFTEIENNVIKYFCQIFENYLQCRFLRFSYIKSIPKSTKKCI